MIVEILTAEQRFSLIELRPALDSSNDAIRRLAAILESIEDTEKRLQKMSLHIQKVESLIECKQYKRALFSIRALTRMIHYLPPNDPLYVFNVYGHQIHLELVRIHTHIDMITFLAEYEDT